MTSLGLTGGNPLYGEITVQGSKNAALPMMAAVLLCKEAICLEHVPDIEDVRVLLDILESLGCRVQRREALCCLQAEDIQPDGICPELFGKLRSSVLLLGPLLGRCGKVKLPYPGGCAIGKRPVDIHLAGLRQMGAVICEEEDGILAEAESLSGARIRMSFPSVGATENLVMAAVCAKGTTILENCAREPEVAALCRFLNQMGARIRGIGTSRLVIKGGGPLHGCAFRVPGDRIVAGTWLLCGAACGGMLEVSGYPVRELKCLYPILRNTGCHLIPYPERMLILSDGHLSGAGLISTAPYPGFPTDLQSLILAAYGKARGQTCIQETVFENRFLAVPELRRMGAQIREEGRSAVVTGVRRLYGTRVRARDLRGGAALVLAGLTAEGETCITDCEHILRGYENLTARLSKVGAVIEEIKE